VHSSDLGPWSTPIRKKEREVSSLDTCRVFFYKFRPKSLITYLKELKHNNNIIIIILHKKYITKHIAPCSPIQCWQTLFSSNRGWSIKNRCLNNRFDLLSKVISLNHSKSIFCVCVKISLKQIAVSGWEDTGFWKVCIFLLIVQSI